jgi:hypothetical protein
MLDANLPSESLEAACISKLSHRNIFRIKYAHKKKILSNGLLIDTSAYLLSFSLL